MEVSTLFYICRYCVFTWYGRINGKLSFLNGKDTGGRVWGIERGRPVALCLNNIMYMYHHKIAPLSEKPNIL